MCSSKLVYVIFKIFFEQTTYDIFLIDWERPKFREIKTGDSEKGGQESWTEFSVNAWRQLFLLNELNELQSYKLINTDATLILYAVLMEGFGMTYWTSYSPNLEFSDYGSPVSYTLFFFVTTAIIYAIGVAQYAIRFIPPFYSKLPMKHISFTDLCSIANCSVLLFDESFHGYYIHGRSPYGQAEISAEKLKLALEFEGSGKANIRGICENYPTLQTFEIFLPKQLMQHYRSDFLQQVEQQINNQNAK